LTILCERYPYRSGLGEIVSLEPNSHYRARRAARIGPPFHRSYPFLIVRSGEVYCVPETYQAREVGLYRAVEFPHVWEKAATLIRDVAAVDSTVFEHDGRWWLFCVDHEQGAEAELFLWYAPDLLGPWSPHRGNPVKTDIRSARPAGTPFVHQGVLYR